jgi:hypothetical protein
VRVPATFVVRSGGKLNPPVVTVPAFLAVQFTIASGDGHTHSVVLKTPVLHTLAVPARGHASLRIPGLRAGQYQIEVDGSVRGSLVIGGEPGP